MVRTRASIRELPEETSLNFHGVDGATSLKAEIVGRIPSLCNTADYRQARVLLQELGGTEALRQELAFAGFVDEDTMQLTVHEKPFNVFAHLAAGVMTQSDARQEQIALGEHRRKFLICRNKVENDAHWDSTDSKWVKSASMSLRHRFLTTKSLHWQWFNMISVGLVPSSEGGADIRAALAEVEEMKSAALNFARNSGDWSDQVGLFVNCFGHNNVNSLFIHILDMTCLGAGFSHHSFKMLPLDDVLKVLREEVATKLASIPSRDKSPSPPRRFAVRRRSCGSGDSKVPFFFRGTDGATSVKEELVGRVPVLNSAAGYREARRLLREEFGGARTLKEELLRVGFIDESSSLLTIGEHPRNVFARLGAGQQKQPNMDAEQEFLCGFKDQFVVCSNLAENDDHWDSEEDEWIGKASMSSRHRFITIKELHWQWFNPIAYGMVDSSDGGVCAQKALEFLLTMKQAALTYVANAGWSDKVGLFFHVFGHNSVNSLHMHVLDMTELGPSFWKLEYKNCPVDAVLKVLNEETRHSFIPSLAEATETMANAAAAAMRMADAMVEKAELQKKNTDSVVDRLRPGKSGVVLTLNVSGELITVSRETLLLAPTGSQLHSMFSDDFHTTLKEVDDADRIFLNLPARSFRFIVSYLQLLQLTPFTKELPPPVVPEDAQREFLDLAWVLDMEVFLTTSQCGKAEDPNRQLMPRVSKQSVEATRVRVPLLACPPQMLMDANGSEECDAPRLLAIREVRGWYCGLCDRCTCDDEQKEG